jgi:hypothetical protein
MRKKNINLIILYPYPFTDIDYRRLELDELYLKHRYNIVIHDLSDFIISKSFKKEWKSLESEYDKALLNINYWNNKKNKLYNKLKLIMLVCEVFKINFNFSRSYI